MIKEFYYFGVKEDPNIIAADTAPNTKKELYYLAEQAHVETMEQGTKAEIGYAIGKAPRTAVAILDVNFARMLKK